VALVLYTAQADGLQIHSAIASWPFRLGHHAPLEEFKPSTLALLLAGKIVAAAPGAVDDTTPANILRGQPGIHDPRTVSN
jgi:hypothetical protein